MGEASRRSRARAEVLAGEPRCIYCSTVHAEGAGFTLEHMPPIGMFRDRQRVSGMEYACCEPCNVGTKGADIAAAVMSLISRHDEPGDWKLDALKRLMPALDRFAPGLRHEIAFGSAKRTWLWTPRGLLEEHHVVDGTGPILSAYLSVFAAKFAMALYREHVGSALPLDGAVYTTHFLNSGLAQQSADAMLRIMPIFGGLRQGMRSSTGQFNYRFNSDDRSIVAALAGFHGNLHVLLFATSDPATYGIVADMPFMRTTRPRELVGRLGLADR